MDAANIIHTIRSASRLAGYHAPGISRAVFAAAVALVALIGVAGCSSVKRYDDALRIRPERQAAYERRPGGASRDGRTLRGTVVEVQIAPGEHDPGRIDTMLLFLDSAAADDAFERIPFADVELVAGMGADGAAAAVAVESFNSTAMGPRLRQVPVRDYRPYVSGPAAPDSVRPCDCAPLDLYLPPIECVQRDYRWYFTELRGAYTGYNDLSRLDEFGREAYLAEIALGVRFGSSKEWGVGMLYSTGINLRDPVSAVEALRPNAMLHLRYQTPGPVTNFLGICMRPFVYSDFGATIDDVSINLMKFNLSTEESCGECGEVLRELEASGQLGDVNLAMPLSYGFGAGVDIPLFSFMDLSADIGWRSIGLGERRDIGGWVLPSLRRVNMFYVRAGVTF